MRQNISYTKNKYKKTRKTTRRTQKRNTRSTNKQFNIDFKRQKSLFDPKRFQETITIIGAGNIGSNTALVLAKMGLKYITVYDFDKVEKHNLSSQFYSIEDVGQSKTKCLSKHIQKFTDVHIITARKYTNQKVYGILIIAVDTMKERKRICNAIKKDPPNIIIDGRMGGNTIEIYTRSSPEEYKETLVEKVDRVPCAERYISYTSFICSGLITNQVKRILKGQDVRRNIILDVDTLRII